MNWPRTRHAEAPSNPCPDHTVLSVCLSVCVCVCVCLATPQQPGPRTCERTSRLLRSKASSLWSREGRRAGRKSSSPGCFCSAFICCFSHLDRRIPAGSFISSLAARKRMIYLRRADNVTNSPRICQLLRTHAQRRERRVLLPLPGPQTRPQSSHVFGFESNKIIAG